MIDDKSTCTHHKCGLLSESLPYATRPLQHAPLHHTTTRSLRVSQAHHALLRMACSTLGQVSSCAIVRLACRRGPVVRSLSLLVRDPTPTVGARHPCGTSGTYTRYCVCRHKSTNSEREASTGAAAEEKPEAVAEPPDKIYEQDNHGNYGRLIYKGSMRHMVGSLKRVSITTCIISILGVPALAMWGKDSVPMAGQAAVMGTALLGTGCSTLLLSLCVSPYVFRMAEILGPSGGPQDERSGQRSPPDKKSRYGMKKMLGRQFRVERMNILGIRKTTEFHLDEVEPKPNSSRPFVSFTAKGKYYYIQGHEMEDKALLRTLLGRPLKEHEE